MLGYLFGQRWPFQNSAVKYSTSRG